MLPSAQSIIIELGCLDICNRNMRKFVVKYNQMECSCKLTSCFVNKMYYFGLLAFRLFTAIMQQKSSMVLLHHTVQEKIAPCSINLNMVQHSVKFGEVHHIHK